MVEHKRGITLGNLSKHANRSLSISKSPQGKFSCTSLYATIFSEGIIFPQNSMHVVIRIACLFFYISLFLSIEILSINVYWIDCHLTFSWESSLFQYLGIENVNCWKHWQMSSMNLVSVFELNHQCVDRPNAMLHFLIFQLVWLYSLDPLKINQI